MQGFVIYILIITFITSLLIVPLVRLFVRRRWLRYVFILPLLTICTLATMSVLTILTVQQSITSQTDIESLIIEQTFVERGNLVVSVTATGAISPRRQVALGFELPGRVQTVAVAVGDPVSAGDVIAELDSTDYEQAVHDAELSLDAQQRGFNVLIAPPREVEIAAANAAVAAAEASYGAATATGPSANQVEIARIQSEQARNQLWQTQLQRDNYLEFEPIPSISANDLPDLGVDDEVVNAAVNQVNAVVAQVNASNQAQNDAQLEQSELSVRQADYGVQIADAQYEATQARGPDYGALGSANAALISARIARDRLINGPSESEVNRAQIDVQSAELNLEQAQLTLEQTRLIAPFDGVIAQSNLRVGELAPPGAGVLLMDTSVYYVDLAIDETDIVFVQQGQQVVFDIDALPDSEITGIVTRVAYTPTVSGQLVTYRVRVELASTEAPIRVGMSATGRIIVNELQNVLLLRNRFIRIDRATGQAFVTVQEESGRFVEAAVVLGSRNETHSEIIGGLEAGQRVVLLPRDVTLTDAAAGNGG